MVTHLSLSRKARDRTLEELGLYAQEVMDPAWMWQPEAGSQYLCACGACVDMVVPCSGFYVQ